MSSNTQALCQAFKPLKTNKIQKQGFTKSVKILYSGVKNLYSDLHLTKTSLLFFIVS